MQPLPQRAIAVMRDAAWFDTERARNYCRILAAVTFVVAFGWIALSHDGVDTAGKPLGTDFLSFWTASKLALSGHAASVYDAHAHYAAQRAAFAGGHLDYAAFFYPPLYLLICLPLAALPYFASLCAWLSLTFYAYWRVAREFLGGAGAGLALPLFAFPAVLLTIGHGQNAFLSTALFGAGILALRTRPIAAGVAFGLLAFKPHLGLLIPVLLIASGRWKTFASAAATVLALVGVSAALFGIATWEAFASVLPFARSTLEQGLVGPEKMQSLFAAIRLWHGSVGAAYAAQAAMAAVAGVFLIALCRQRPESDAQGPALMAATLLASPFLLDYDLMLLAIPLAWLFSEGRRTGFLPWEKLILLAAFTLPAFSRLVATRYGVPSAPLVDLAVFALVLRRGFLAAPRQGVARPAG